MIRKAAIAVMAGVVSAASALVVAQSTEPATQPAPATRPDVTTQPSPEVLRLIDLMGAPKYQTRAHAQANLVKIGQPAEPALKQAADESDSAEIRARATAAVIDIEQNVADAPTYITLHANKARIRTVLQDISRQAGVHVSLADQGFVSTWLGPNAGTVTLDLDHVPFWAAIQAFCAATHTHPQFAGMGMNGEFTLNPGDGGQWSQHGRFAFIPTAINHDSSIDLINGGGGKNDMITMMAYVDPKFHSATFDGMQLTTADDEHGISLLAPGMMAPNFFMGGFQQSWCYPLNASLNFPDNYGHTLTRLEGSTTVHLPMESETLKIPDIVKAIGTPTVAGNHKVDVVQCNFAGGNVVIMHLQISKLERSSTQNYPGGLFAEFNTARVYDSQGTPLMGGGGGSGTDMQIDWQGQFTSGGRPIKPPFSLNWEIISRVETVAVPFKFKNLPLPPH
jgi:hypothetical protein